MEKIRIFWSGSNESYSSCSSSLPDGSKATSSKALKKRALSKGSSSSGEETSLPPSQKKPPSQKIPLIFYPYPFLFRSLQLRGRATQWLHTPQLLFYSTPNIHSPNSHLSLNNNTPLFTISWNIRSMSCNSDELTFFIKNDLNALHCTCGNPGCNTRGHMLQDYFDNCSIDVIHNTTATRTCPTSGQGTILDFCALSSSIASSFTVSIHNDTHGSDHHWPTALKNAPGGNMRRLTGKNTK